jgi:quercetin dioxygenase-like cupin family protein
MRAYLLKVAGMVGDAGIVAAVTGPLEIDWDAREFAELRPGIRGSTIVSADLTVTMYRYAAGSQWEEHTHPEDQLTAVLSGEIVFRSNGAELRLGPGRQVLIPGGVSHSAEAGPEEVVTLNVWPPRE